MVGERDRGKEEEQREKERYNENRRERREGREEGERDRGGREREEGKEREKGVVDGRASRDAAFHAGGSGFDSRSRPDLRLVWKSCSFL
jgi:hypothetical protein